MGTLSLKNIQTIPKIWSGISLALNLKIFGWQIRMKIVVIKIISEFKNIVMEIIKY